MRINDDQMFLWSGAAADIYHQLSLDLFEQVVAALKKRGTADLKAHPYIWQLEKLNDMHLLNEANVKLIVERSGVAERVFRNAIEREGLKVYQDTKEQLAHDLGVDAGQYNGVQNALTAYAGQTFREVNNLINTTLPASVQSVYKGIVEETVASVVMGLKSPQRALNETVMRWYDKGFYGFTDKAGRKWRADVYARNVITSTTYRVYNQMRTQASEEMGVDTYYYSKKAAARPDCAAVQGRIVTKGAAFTEKGVEVLSLLDHGYGSAGGCLGINCRHTMTPFIIGVNQLPDLPDHLKSITPAQAIENGKKQAQQRAFEREIRKAKEKLTVAKQLGYPEAIDKYGAKVKNLQGGLNQLLKDNPFLHRDMVRERGRKAEYLDDVRKNLVVNHQKAYNKLRDILGDRTPTLKEYGEILLNPVLRKALSHDYRVVKYFQGEIKENLSDKQKKQAVAAYFNFKKQGILFGDHGIARYIERLRRKDGTLIYNFQTVVAMFDKSVNYVSGGRDVRYYNDIMIITEKGTKNIVTMMKRKEVDKRWKKP